MTTKRIQSNLSDNPKLNELFREAMDRFNALSPEEKAAHRRDQHVSWVVGEMLLTRFERGEPELSNEEKEKLQQDIEDLYDRREREKKDLSEE
jgi:hypothetical protein